MSENNVLNEGVLYFLQTESKTVMSFQVTGQCLTALKDLKETGKNSISHSFVKIIQFLNAQVAHAVIYKCLEDNYYAYIRIQNRGEFYDFNCDFYDVLTLCLLNSLDIFIEEELLITQGIKITNELINELSE